MVADLGDRDSGGAHRADGGGGELRRARVTGWPGQEAATVKLMGFGAAADALTGDEGASSSRVNVHPLHASTTNCWYGT